MKIAKFYISPVADNLMRTCPAAVEAYHEVEQSIIENTTPGKDIFILNDTSKNCNGVVPVKERCYQILEEDHLWYREKPLSYFHDDAQKGGPIDVYKEFRTPSGFFRAGLEFETGNISSAHRSMNKLCVGILKGEIDLAMLMMPIKQMSYYLTDRVSNYEELEPYFILLDNYPFVVFGFDAEQYRNQAPFLPKGKDGMSPRTKRKWQNNHD
ncbi:type-2 restriction enzyme BamHI [Oscillibacter valericigenes Sjm18-20]|nr:type-2 restriction enzyme BamHI [Oscillibacter valericigenes Sjm18-20]